jgi:hypothetical protein
VRCLRCTPQTIPTQIGCLRRAAIQLPQQRPPPHGGARRRALPRRQSDRSSANRPARAARRHHQCRASAFAFPVAVPCRLRDPGRSGTRPRRSRRLPRPASAQIIANQLPVLREAGLPAALSAAWRRALSNNWNSAVAKVAVAPIRAAITGSEKFMVIRCYLLERGSGRLRFGRGHPAGAIVSSASTLE